jgi:hypothetical protein
MSADHRECISDDGRCSAYWPGHNMHFIHAKHVGRTPWGWRDGIVESVTDGWAEVRYLLEEGRVSVWHHTELATLLSPGDPVRVHERFHALGGPFGWLNVEVRGGLGAVPDPEEPDVWAQETTGGVVDLSTGRALPLDHLDEGTQA